MKYLKMLGLAAIAAMGLMAFLGAGSASATVLCTSTDTPGCEAAHKYGVGTVIDAKLLKTATLEAGSTTLDTCTGGTVKGSISNAGGASATVSGNILETEDEGGVKTFPGLTWTGCTATTKTLASGSLEIHYIAGTHNGTITGSGSKVTVSIFGTSCVYGSNKTHLGTLNGGAAPVIQINTTVPLIEGNFFCPSSASWTAEYEVTEPHALFVTES